MLADAVPAIPVEPASRTRLIFPGLAPFYALAEPLAYAGLRVLMGSVILTHGIPKLFRLSHGAGTPDAFANVVRTLGQRMGLPAPEAIAVLITAIETIGAAMLIVGLFTRLVAPTISIMMLVVAVGVHWEHWAWSERGMEYPVVLAGIFAMFAFRGGGRYSLDHLRGREI